YALPGFAAQAAARTDYTIGIDPQAKGASIDDTMYGVFFEDINRAADGGLYAELVQNRSFEYDPADNAGYTPLTGWAPTGGTLDVVDDDARLNERNRRHLKLGL
ncbi:alpha-N-arabinofuranosidase, partial [Saccharothrix sp. MB29]|nr:alpha-N-arabinofuranosidase [Saccharothrix sp. MB29]